VAKGPEDRVACAIERDFGVRFSKRVRLGGWGYTDNAVELSDRVLLVLETEATQSHPCTNVLKLWPYLEENPRLRVILVHVFQSGAKNERSSRARLASFVAAKLCDELPESFACCRLQIDEADVLHGETHELQQLLQEARSGELGRR